ncbi:hypothetical protein JKP88DRAFT_163896 [Tribonema minus]|uniref:DUSP domain-containing protein n=1 Tax=Tribonema minus TaxID=303371 RepID=A0A835Z5F7_9STRA|nr:hypothetical protein JKP88DRAFT_163896 [Tribonema minus]
MAFLEIDFARVHIEEEGRVVGEVLDSANVLPGTVWQVVSEEWMAQWRKFVQSRGARRYLPPGPITNGELLMRQEVVKEVK